MSCGGIFPSGVVIGFWNVPKSVLVDGVNERLYWCSANYRLSKKGVLPWITIYILFSYPLKMKST
jgi:hypothetical protein